MAEKVPIGGRALIETVVTDLETGDVPSPLPTTVTVRIFGPTPDDEISSQVMTSMGATTVDEQAAGLPKGQKYHTSYLVPETDQPGPRYTRIELDFGAYQDRGFIEHTFNVKL